MFCRFARNYLNIRPAIMLKFLTKKFGEYNVVKSN
jgi:hypothetical protein